MLNPKKDAYALAREVRTMVLIDRATIDTLSIRERKHYYQLKKDVKFLKDQVKMMEQYLVSQGIIK